MASAAVLGLIIEADNRASRALDTVTGDIDDMSDAAERANKKFAGLKTAMGTGLKVAGAAAAAGVAAVGAVMVSSVRAAADAEEAQSKFNVVFADTAGTAATVTSEMDAFAKASGRNKYMLREMAAGFGDVLKPMGFSVDAAGGLSTEMTQLAIDLGSFNNMRPEEAFERLSSTLIGNHANALSFGVIINEAILKEELMAMGADDLSGALLEQAKVQARINILMRGTTDAQGDAVRTGDSWTNTMLRLNSTIDEQKTALGLRLLPVFTPLLAAFTDLAEKYVPKAADALAGFVENIDTEAIIANLDTFMKGLTEGTFELGPIKVDITPQWVMGEGGLAEKKEISIDDLFTFSSETDLTSFMTIKKLSLGDILVGANTVSGSTTIGIDGVMVESKLTVGDLFDAQWIDGQGFVKLKVGSVDFADAENNNWETLETLMSWTWPINPATWMNKLVEWAWPVLETTDLEAMSASMEDAGLRMGEGLAAATATIFSEDNLSGLTTAVGTAQVNMEAGLMSVFTGIGTGMIAAGTLAGLSFSKEVDNSSGVSKIEQFSADVEAAGLSMGESLSSALSFTNLSGLSEAMGAAGEQFGSTINMAVSEFAWSDWINKLKWTTFLDKLSWATRVPILGWSLYVSKIAWRTWIPDVNWRDFIPTFGGGGAADSETEEPVSQSDQPLSGLATGTSFFRGGMTMVGETGPELVRLPRGSEIFSAGKTAQMASGGGVTINVAATVANEFDAHVLARQVVNIINRGGY